MKPTDDPELTAACRRYGARRVYDAAHGALRVAYLLLTTEDQGADGPCLN